MFHLEVLKQRAFTAEKMQKISLVETAHFFCDIYCLCPGQSQKLHQHADADKIYFVLEGEVAVQVGDEIQVCSAGQLVLAPAGEQHGVHNGGQENVTLLVLMAPNPNVRSENSA
jgi:mannose-6-phosphate isomerase-like protein (cupin superfamily)